MKTFLLIILCIVIIMFIEILIVVKTKFECFVDKPETYIKESNNEYEIKHFKDCSKEIKQEVSKYLNKEWKNETGMNYTEQFIDTTWKFPDAFYVMTDKKGEFMGCSSVDHKYMSYPFISHIYVNEQYRKKGVGEKMFDIVLRHSKNIGHTRVYGWCKDNLVPYYEKFGCEKQSSWKLWKPLVGLNLMTKEL